MTPALLLLRAGVEHADRDFLADEDLRLAIVERHDARLGLKVGEPHFLKRVEEAGELELAERCREDELSAGLTTRAFALAIAARALPPSRTRSPLIGVAAAE